MTISYKVSDNIKSEMIEYYQDLKRDKTPQYATFQAEEAGTIITLYDSGKVVFQGLSADIDASMWFDLEMHKNNRDVRKEIDLKDKDKKEEKDYRYYNLSAIGSDEVGTGDYFGPIVVTASFVDKKDHMYLIDLGIKDSKKLSDEKIRSIAPKIIEKFPHVTYILDNETYNKNPDFNMNKMKAILHNKVLVGLLEKDNYPYERIIMDQFVYPKKYFEHIQDSTKKVTNILFLTKAEDKNLSVAVASIIARYTFINYIDKLSEKYNLTIPKGAGPLVDQAGKKIVAEYGFNELNLIAKLNFKNTEKIKSNEE
ncbi:MAG: ribonuclease HIII [Mollicutes bacterium]|nr:ribonuclease HIII [Mollicutes bacterium]